MSAAKNNDTNDEDDGEVMDLGICFLRCRVDRVVYQPLVGSSRYLSATVAQND